MATRSKTAGDPTGQRANRARTTRKLNARLTEAKGKVISLFRSVPKSRRSVTKVRNAEKQAVYDYDQTPEQNENFNKEIAAIIALLLLQTSSGDSMPQNWFLKPDFEEPTRQGTLTEINEFNRLITIAIGAGVLGAGGITPQRISPEAVLSSQRYLQELRRVYIDNFQIVKSLSDTTANQVIGVINSGMRAGLTPTEIAGQITERFDVAQSSAKRIAHTEVNRAYNEAIMRATKQAEEISGLKALVRHISALLPTTRSWHAARHMNVYEVEQQRAWWQNEWYNCYCTVATVLVDNNGNYIETGEIRGPGDFV